MISHFTSLTKTNYLNNNRAYSKFYDGAGMVAKPLERKIITNKLQSNKRKYEKVVGIGC